MRFLACFFTKVYHGESTFGYILLFLAARMVFSYVCFQHLCFATYVDVHAHAFSRALSRERQAAAILNHIK